MSKIHTTINRQDPAFALNYRHHTALRDQLQSLHSTLALGGDQTSRDRHTSRGKLLPRERVEALLDTGSPFLELSSKLKLSWGYWAREAGIQSVSNYVLRVVAIDSKP